MNVTEHERTRLMCTTQNLKGESLLVGRKTKIIQNSIKQIIPRKHHQLTGYITRWMPTILKLWIYQYHLVMIVFYAVLVESCTILLDMIPSVTIAYLMRCATIHCAVIAYLRHM